MAEMHFKGYSMTDHKRDEGVGKELGITDQQNKYEKKLTELSDKDACISNLGTARTQDGKNV